MALTTSAFFWASCAAVLIPLLIHLLRRHKPKQILFPPLELVRQRQNTSQRRFRFRQAALLFLRAAVLLLFGLLLARPAAQTGIRKSESGPSARAAVLLFDTSLRMGYEQNGRTRLEEAKTLGLALLDAMPSETRVAVSDTQNSGAAFQIDHLAARERIEQQIWNYDYEGGSNIVDVYIRGLRKKLSVSDDDAPVIETVRGLGYVIR